MSARPAVPGECPRRGTRCHACRVDAGRLAVVSEPAE